MKTLIKILYINVDYQVIYIIIFDGIRIKTPLPLKIALSMLEDEKFDLIFFEPQNMAVLTPLTATDHQESIINSSSKRSLGSLPTDKFPLGYSEKRFGKNGTLTN